MMEAARNDAGEGECQEDDLEQQPIDLSWPKTLYKQCIFLLLAPIMIPLYFTLPDVKREDRRKFAALTFLGSGSQKKTPF
jgi:hypothetical protein